MKKPTTIKGYIDALPEERQEAFLRLKNTISDNIDAGFEETLSYGMIGWVVPHSTYPDGYHCKPEDPVPFVNLGNQKGFIAVYHSGLYADQVVYDWFVKEYPKHCKYKLDMGKSCIRFKKIQDIPYDLIAELMQKFTVKSWIELYEKKVKK